MQTPAEKFMLLTMRKLIESNDFSVLLNLGAGKSTVIEGTLNTNVATRFICDRLDISDCKVSNQVVRNCFRLSVESMIGVSSEEYDIVFSNYVLEHVKHIENAIREIYRVLKPNGVFLATVPNPKAPEFLLARVTPLSFHKWTRNSQSWEKYYSFRSIKQLVETLSSVGFNEINCYSWAFSVQYTSRIPGGYFIGNIYDSIINNLRLSSLKGNYCIICKK